MFEKEYKIHLNKKESITKRENTIFKDKICEFSFSENLEIQNPDPIIRTEPDQEIYKKNLFDWILNDDIDKNSIKMNKQIFTSCLIKDRTLLCKIKKSNIKSKYGKKITIYHLYTDFTNKFLLSCKKISNLTNTEYIFTISDDPLNCSEDSILGKIVSKFLGNEYNLYGNSDIRQKNILLGTIDYVIIINNLLIVRV